MPIELVLTAVVVGAIVCIAVIYTAYETGYQNGYSKATAASAKLSAAEYWHGVEDERGRIVDMAGDSRMLRRLVSNAVDPGRR